MANSHTTTRSNSPIPPVEPPTSLSKPRLLCLHGGGVNSDVFRMQCRSLIKHLSAFRFVFADGPWFCEAGPGIFPVYEDCGPFRRWLRWLPHQPETDDESAKEEIFYEIERCKREDDEKGATGEWVGLVGFSQGAKVAASLLYDQQIRKEKNVSDGKWGETDYKFAVLMAGRNPLVSFGEYSHSEALVTAGGLSEGFVYNGESPHILKVPTLHVHGLRDAGLQLHRRLLKQYCDPETSDAIEWDGDHRVPIKTTDVKPIKDWVYGIARREGISLVET
ncbi:hypothetical protein CERZMDRAFT_95639 [Cercospora zeae-maydis SCOH1-5]|uniref:Serine hydrolase domain-containing protein n=1 Tax=Cercospora zeae-maydis SCOH1-5 TaxID=717836 RepID=A0A6A6FLP4_9PEZI|nr:hypothetical protein CERZMDRAFT_95639 [Cercospora zeae-maydis SCOH1-5]